MKKQISLVISAAITLQSVAFASGNPFLLAAYPYNPPAEGQDRLSQEEIRRYNNGEMPSQENNHDNSAQKEQPAPQKNPQIATGDLELDIQLLTLFAADLEDLKQQIKQNEVKARQATEYVNIAALVSIFGIVSLSNSVEIRKNGSHALAEISKWMGYIATLGGISATVGGIGYTIKVRAADLPRLRQAVDTKYNEIEQLLMEMEVLKNITNEQTKTTQYI